MKHLFSLVFVAASAALFGQNIPSYVPSNGLVAWYPFNGNANDESGNGNNGTVNGATLTADRDGNANSAFYIGSPDVTVNATGMMEDTNEEEAELEENLSDYGWLPQINFRLSFRL